MSLPALQPTADTRSLTERVNVLIRDYNNPPAPQRFVPPGVVLPFAGASAPAGFLLCGGQAVSRATYAALFAAIGTTFGAGDGSTTFNVVDLRGRVPGGKDDMGGAAAGRIGVIATDGGTIVGTALGSGGGSAVHALTAGEMPSHGHAVNDPGHVHIYHDIFTSGAPLLQVGGSAVGGGAADNPATTGITIDSAGGGAAHALLQPTVIVNYILRVI